MGKVSTQLLRKSSPNQEENGKQETNLWQWRIGGMEEEGYFGEIIPKKCMKMKKRARDWKMAGLPHPNPPLVNT